MKCPPPMAMRRTGRANGRETANWNIKQKRRRVGDSSKIRTPRPAPKPGSGVTSDFIRNAGTEAAGPPIFAHLVC